jgi:hypothetical protein
MRAIMYADVAETTGSTDDRSGYRLLDRIRPVDASEATFVSPTVLAGVEPPKGR